MKFKRGKRANRTPDEIFRDTLLLFLRFMQMHFPTWQRQLTIAKLERGDTVRVSAMDLWREAVDAGLSCEADFREAAGLAAAIPAAQALAVEVTAVGSGLAAAGAGAVAFGVLAKPAFSAVADAVKNINKDQLAYDNALTKTARNNAAKRLKQDWAGLDPVQRQTVRSVQALSAEYHNLSKAFEPSAFKVFNGALGIARTLLPKVTPFAKTFADTIASFETRIGNAAKSKGFQSFLNQFHALEGPALKAIGNGIANLLPNIGRLFTIFSSKDVVHGINIAFSILDGTVIALSYAVNRLRTNWDGMWGAAKTGFFAAAPVVLKGAKGLTDAVLSAFHGITHGAAIAFGWVPGLGPKLRQADRAVQSWRTSVDKQFGAAVNAVNGWKRSYENAPKVAKLKGNITDLTSKLNSAKGQLRNPALTATKRAYLRAEIAQLEGAIARARAELNSIQGKTVTTYIDTVKRSFSTPGKGGHVPLTGYAMGGNAPSGLHWVGERGPELADFGRTTRVYTAQQSKEIAGSAKSALVGTQNVYVQNPGPTASDVIAASLYELRRVRLAGTYA